MTVENEWHGFDRAWHMRIHPTINNNDCLMCQVEMMETHLAAASNGNAALLNANKKLSSELSELKRIPHCEYKTHKEANKIIAELRADNARLTKEIAISEANRVLMSSRNTEIANRLANEQVVNEALITELELRNQERKKEGKKQ